MQVSAFVRSIKMTRVAWKFLIRGEVQGVGYRFFAQRAAARHQVLGLVRNCPDGSVEVVAEGLPSAVEEFKKDHGVEYQRLVDSGEWQRHLVEPTSAGMVKASKVLGFTLIAIGLTLLTLVGIGFFKGG